METRILVVANETCPGRELREVLLRLGSSGEREVLVVAPALNGALATWASDTDGAMRRARERVDGVVRALRDEGVDAEGQVGDRNPLVAIEDALRWFPADAIVVATHPPGRSRWLRRRIVERAARRFGLPVTHVVVDPSADRTLVLGLAS